MNEPKTVTHAQLRQANLTVLDHVWHEEREHFLLSPSADRANHIFAALTILARWLGRTDEFTRD